MIDVREVSRVHGATWWKGVYRGNLAKDNYLCTQSPTNPEIIYLLKGDDMITIQPDGIGRVITSEMNVYCSLDDYFDSLDHGVTIVYKIIPVCFVEYTDRGLYMYDIGNTWFVGKWTLGEYHFHLWKRGRQLMESIYNPYCIRFGGDKQHTVTITLRWINNFINNGAVPKCITWYDSNGKFKKVERGNPKIWIRSGHYRSSLMNTSTNVVANSALGITVHSYNEVQSPPVALYIFMSMSSSLTSSIGTFIIKCLPSGISPETNA